LAGAAGDATTGAAAGISEREADSLAGSVPVEAVVDAGVTEADDPAGLDSIDGVPAAESAARAAAVVDCPAVAAAARVTSARAETDEAAVRA
jgi:hypothetical protein